jgi:guanosine-3',5'-bis(diphosphate) 3'-pyrophosphohydrolase
MAMSKDLRVILVKLADRLHNMRTIKAMRPKSRRRRRARRWTSTRRWRAAWACSGCARSWKTCLPRAQPRGAQFDHPPLHHAAAETGDVIHKITADMRTSWTRRGHRGRGLRPREEALFDLAQDAGKGEGFSRLSDIYGFRIITRTEADCYRVLGAIHQRWRAVPGRFKDYISQPKSNGYRSIHTTVSGRDGKRVEVQIRTRQMHEVAEAGVAAHWSYRDGVRAENPFAVDPAKWIAALTEQFDASRGPRRVPRGVKLEMYSDQVFCFTPKGDVVKLPRGPRRWISPMRSTPGSATAASAPRSTASACRSGPGSRTASRSRSSPPRADAAGHLARHRDHRQGQGRDPPALREEDRERFIKLGRELARVAFEASARRPPTRR